MLSTENIKSSCVNINNDLKFVIAVTLDPRVIVSVTLEPFSSRIIGAPEVWVTYLYTLQVTVKFFIVI